MTAQPEPVSASNRIKALIGKVAGGQPLTLDESREAFDVIMGGVSDAFDLSKENPRIIQQYDTARFKPTRAVLRKPTKNAKKIPEFSPVALGKQLLMARRLCESGCGFVTVTSCRAENSLSPPSLRLGIRRPA